MSDPILEYRFQNLHEFVKVARQNLNRNHWDYLIGASESETSIARNRLALDTIGFRPRVLRDVSDVDCSKELFGKRLRIPVLCAPVGSLEVFDPEGGAYAHHVHARDHHDHAHGGHDHHHDHHHDHGHHHD